MPQSFWLPDPPEVHPPFCLVVWIQKTPVTLKLAKIIQNYLS